MSEQRTRGEEIDLDAFQAWVDRVAEQETTSRETVLNQLVSTYWLVTELTEALEDTENTGTGTANQPWTTPNGATQEDTADATAQGASTPPAVDPSLISLVQALQAGPSTPDGPTPTDRATIRREMNRDRRTREAAVTALDGQRRIDDIREDLTILRERHATAETDTTERLESMEMDLRTVYEELRTAIETTHRTMRSITHELEGVEEHTAVLAADLRTERDERVAALQHLAGTMDAQSETIDALDAALDGVAADLAGLTEDHDRAVTSFQEALDAVAAHLDTLYHHTDETTCLIVALGELLAAELTPVIEDRHGSRHLERILEDAHAAGITRCACEGCGDAIELALLRRPVCPHCDRALTGIDRERRFLRKRPVMRTSEATEQFVDTTIEAVFNEMVTAGATDSGSPRTDVDPRSGEENAP